MSISEIGRSIGESATLKLNAKAGAMRAQGEPVIHLGGGEPKSKAPREAIEAAAKLLATGEVRYVPCDGTAEMKRAIIRYTAEWYGHEFGPDQVMASGGAKQAIMVALQAVLNPGDEVLFPAPYWVSYPDMARLCGARFVAVPPADETLRPDLGDIVRRVTPRTRVIIINSPNNPSGVVYPPGFIRDIVEFCEDHGIYLITDDIYHRLVFDGTEVASPCAFARKLGDDSRLIIVNGVSKQYAMTGFRIGWAVASPELIRVMGNIQTHQTSGPSVIGQVAAAAAIAGDQACVDDLRATLERNRGVMLDALAGFAGVRPVRPDGTFYCLVDFRHHGASSARLAETLLERVKVVTVPGIEFGLEGYLRLSTCGAADDIREGVARIRWALDPEAPREIEIGGRTLVRE